MNQNYQEVASLALPPTIRQKLQSVGFRKASDFRNIGPVDLSKEAQLTHQEALEVLEVVQGEAAHLAIRGARSASELLRMEQTRRSVAMLCPELDQLLGGGVSPGEVTEFCGVPGIGKTQVGMQLAVSVQIPRQLGGLGGQAVYIDTEGSLVPERVADMAAGLVKEVQLRARRCGTQSAQEAAAEVTVESVLARIHYFRVHNATEQRALLNSLGPFLKSHLQVKLIVVDSIAFHFRQDFPDMSQRTKILNEASLLLMNLAHTYSLAVVTMNQVTTRVSAIGGQSALVPALGESFAHACTTRIILFWRNGQRNANLHKSPRLPQGVASYIVTQDGIRGEIEDKNIQRKRQYDDFLQG
eukprot:CAMPEP_0196575850 /NCGR_PEP_ID=MMETSP1081-20130531/5236_1 /TAXON_ID=36882 /ORGANISM="Pyramimonas amylifera, Strain CCMP720" /LENGTH=355 /DNA_ID=CAMNT_0041894269 /DNA_START=470 /DNA_END=1537 /DNA_ORIENTATION=+